MLSTGTFAPQRQLATRCGRHRPRSVRVRESPAYPVEDHHGPVAVVDRSGSDDLHRQPLCEAGSLAGLARRGGGGYIGAQGTAGACARGRDDLLARERAGRQRKEQ